MIGLVVPTKTDAYARRLLRSLAVCEPEWEERTRVVVVNSGLSVECLSELREMDGVIVIDTALPFVFARAINDGASILSAPSCWGGTVGTKATDILIMNDDAVFCSPRPIAALEALLEEPGDAGRRVRDLFGVIGLRIEGGVGNQEQTARVSEEQILETDKTICFVAALIPRAVWDRIGGLDERFVGYGFRGRRRIATCSRSRLYARRDGRRDGASHREPGHGGDARHVLRVGPRGAHAALRAQPASLRREVGRVGTGGDAMIAARFYIELGFGTKGPLTGTPAFSFMIPVLNYAGDSSAVGSLIVRRTSLYQEIPASGNAPEDYSSTGERFQADA